LQFVINIGHLT